MITGYDTLQVISRMDTSRNALEEVEQYISTEFIEDPCFQRGVTNCGVTNCGTFKFLPGHQQRNTDFMDKIKRA